VFVLGTLVWLTTGSPGDSATFSEPPTIDTSITERKIDIALNAQGFDKAALKENDTGGPFSGILSDAGFGDKGTTVSSFALQRTYISSFSIRGRGEGEVKANVSPLGWARVDGESALTVQFTIPVDHPFTLEGKLDSSHVGGSSGFAYFLMTWFDASTGQIENYFKESASSSVEEDGEVTLEKDGTIMANTMVTIQVSGGGSVPITADGSMNAAASFEFDFDLGDRDGDGLLDDWETDGIDIDGDGTLEIDLPSYGADPDRKDIFVEIDVMSGVPFGQPAQDAIYDVIEAFANAPASMVDNPNGAGGVNLHVEWDDGDAPSTPGGNANLSGAGWPTQFDAIKAASFGSPDDRNPVGFWQTDFRPIRMLVFRYCLWANEVVNNGKKISGIAEITGNDLVVAAGSVGTWWSSVLRDALAGTFMHELGHTLSLLHGGKGSPEQAMIAYKPNYSSVMSYAYQYPRDKVTAQGSNAMHFWTLDYSRKAAITLNENQLKEGIGIDGTPGRFIIFNSAPAGSAPVLTVANAIASEINWDYAPPFPDPNPVQRDVNRFRSSQAVNYDAALVSYRDWEELWYHLSGDPDFADGVAARDVAAIQPNMDLEAEMEILSAEWVDMTGDSDKIFFDDFEYGDTSAWTSRRP